MELALISNVVRKSRAPKALLIIIFFPNHFCLNYHVLD
jgi:hypothetical protein